MQALGMIETKGLLAAIEAADTMLKAADVAFYEKQRVGGGRVTVLVTGDVAAVKAAVDAGVMAVKQLQTDCLLSCHVIPRPHDETMKLFEHGEDMNNNGALLTVQSPEQADIPVKQEDPAQPEDIKPGTAELGTAEPQETKSSAAVNKSERQEKAEPKSSKKNKEK